MFTLSIQRKESKWLSKSTTKWRKIINFSTFKIDKNNWIFSNWVYSWICEVIDVWKRIFRLLLLLVAEWPKIHGKNDLNSIYFQIKSLGRKTEWLENRRTYKGGFPIKIETKITLLIWYKYFYYFKSAEADISKLSDLGYIFIGKPTLVDISFKFWA